jgi:RimJ/RimL family protein N-acetyltransferase
MWGHGYATEAARAALNDAFIRMRLDEVVALYRP